jgi:hypothetical protein
MGETRVDLLRLLEDLRFETDSAERTLVACETAAA